MFILIKSAEVETQSGTSKRDGRAYNIRKQHGVAVFSEDHRVPVRVPLTDTQTPYAVGRYAISGESFAVNQYGDLEITRLRLEPSAAEALKRAG